MQDLLPNEINDPRNARCGHGFDPPDCPYEHCLIRGCCIALGDAAREINCAGPVAHRIRVMRQEHQARADQQAARIAELEKQVKDMEPIAAFGHQCIQDRCENAYVEASVVKRLESELAALRKALEPFARVAFGGIEMDRYGVPIAALKAARAALGIDPEKESF